MILMEKDFGWYKIRHLSINPKDKLSEAEYELLFNNIKETIGVHPKTINKNWKEIIKDENKK